MGFKVVEFEDTPNPHAVKCWLDRPISDGMRGFRNAAAAAEDPVARALFAEAAITNVLLGGEWLTVNKRQDAAWADVKKKVAAVLADIPAAADVE